MHRRDFVRTAVGAVAAVVVGPKIGWSLDAGKFGSMREGRSLVLMEADPSDIFSPPISELPVNHGLDFKWLTDQYREQCWPDNFEEFKKYITAYWEHRTPEMLAHYPTYEEFERAWL